MSFCPRFGETRPPAGLTIRRLHPISIHRIQTAPLGLNSRNVEHCQDTQRRDHQDRSTRVTREPRTNAEGTFAAATGDRFVESPTQAGRAQRLRRRTRSIKNSRKAACRGIDEAGQVHAQGNRFDAAAIGSLGRRSREAAVGKRSNDLQLGTWRNQTATRASSEAGFAASRWQERATRFSGPVCLRVKEPNVATARRGLALARVKAAGADKTAPQCPDSDPESNPTRRLRKNGRCQPRNPRSGRYEKVSGSERSRCATALRRRKIGAAQVDGCQFSCAASRTKNSRLAGLAIASGLVTCSLGVPSSNRRTGTSIFLPVSVRGMSGTAYTSSGT